MIQYSGLMATEHNIINNEGNYHFEIVFQDDEAYIQYKIRGDVLTLYFIFVPPAERGKGLSGILIQYALDFAKEKHLKVEVYCSFINRYLALHPEMEYVKA